MTTKWVERYASRTQRMRSSTIRELLKITQQPDIISFAGGLPAPELFPVEAVREATLRVLEQGADMALQYGTTEGYLPLREMIVRHMARYGIHCGPENVLITSGSQQALDLIGKILVDTGDHLIVEEPTYLGALQAWAPYGPDYLTVPSDDDGICPDGLERAIQANNAKFIYTIPNFQNPSGATIPHERRVEIVRLAETYGIPIIEDDPYGQLRYEGRHEKPLVVIDAQRRDDCDRQFISGNIIYLSTFSKTLCPGLRVAWIVAPTAVIEKLVQAKQGSDLHTSTFTQMVAYETARGGFLDQHVQTLRRVYRERRDLMLSLIEEHFPEGTTWTRPLGGLFLWVRLPQGCNTTELLPKAVAHKVAFVPGSPFFPNGGGENTMRLNFSNAQPEMIETGIKRLAAMLKKELAHA
ncbi:MAG: PLP-dependent aminotransferase family protein [Anaerolineae bacterium]